MRLSHLTCVLALFFTSLASANPKIGDPAPGIDLPSLDGSTVRLNPRAEQILIVDFFATWCGPCQEAMSALDGLLRMYPGRVSLIIIDVGQTPREVRAFFSAHPLPAGAQVVIDPDGQVARRWGQDRFPTTFLIDGHGVIRHINRGYGSGYAARLSAWLRSMWTP